MKLKIVNTLCLIVFSAGISCAQVTSLQPMGVEPISNAYAMYLQDVTNMSKSINYQSVTNWGETNCECQLSIGLDDDVVRAGSSTVFHSWIKNASTNSISLARRSWSLQPRSLILTNTTGFTYTNNYQDSPDGDGHGQGTTKANPGEFIVGEFLIQFSRTIEPGDYLITPFTRRIMTADGKIFTLTSNTLKVKVIAASP